jgi:tetratricopeptide (TPR) repeat protein
VSLGKRMRRLRQTRGLSQAQLAAPLYTHAYVSTIEAGRRRPSQKALEHFAEKLEVDVDELATGRPPDFIPRMELELQQARIALAAGRAAEAEAALEGVSRKARHYELVGLQARADQGLALCAERQGRIEEAIERYEAVEDLLRSGSLVSRVDAIAGKARCLQMLGDLNYSIHLLETALDLLSRERVADPDSLVRLHTSLLAGYFQAGMFAQAGRSADEALGLASSATDPERLANMHLNVAAVLLHDKHFDEAQRSLARAEELFSQLELKSDMARARLARGVVLGRAGDLNAARVDVEAAALIFAETGGRIDQARAMCELGRIERVAGSVDAARRHLNLGLELLGEQGDIGVRGTAHRELGLCEATSDLRRAEKHMRRACELFERGGENGKLAATFRLLGDMLRDSGDVGAANDAYRAGVIAVEEPP